jgi:hypothetical protein
MLAPFNPIIYARESSTRTYGVINGVTAREINRFAFNVNNKIIRHPAVTFDSYVVVYYYNAAAIPI